LREARDHVQSVLGDDALSEACHVWHGATDRHSAQIAAAIHMNPRQFSTYGQFNTCRASTLVQPVWTIAKVGAVLHARLGDGSLPLIAPLFDYMARWSGASSGLTPLASIESPVAGKTLGVALREFGEFITAYGEQQSEGSLDREHLEGTLHELREARVALERCEEDLKRRAALAGGPRAVAGEGRR
jgi:hypothetical protein